MNVLQFILTNVSKHLDFFSFEGNFTQDRYKRFAELAIFSHYVGKYPTSQRYKSYRAIHAHLSEKMVLVSPDDIFKNFYIAYHMVMPYVFIRHETPIEPLEKSLEIICQQRFFSPEIPPHRQMEWDYMLHKIGKKDVLSLPDHSILSTGCHLPFLDRDLAYAITHALFYAMDFGFSTNVPVGLDVENTAFRVACLLARFYEAKDVDVALELAISYLALYPHMANRKEADRLLHDVLHLIDLCIHETSFLNLAPEEEETVDMVLEKKYHTLFVFGIFSSLLHVRIEEGIVPKPVQSIALTDALVNYMPQEIPLEDISLVAAWRIVDSLKKKNYVKEPYEEYQKQFGRSSALEQEITYYLTILKQRNQENILWSREFAALKVPPEHQEVLRAQSDADLTAKMPRAK